VTHWKVSRRQNTIILFSWKDCHKKAYRPGICLEGLADGSIPSRSGRTVRWEHKFLMFTWKDCQWPGNISVCLVGLYDFPTERGNADYPTFDTPAELRRTRKWLESVPFAMKELTRECRVLFNDAVWSYDCRIICEDVVNELFFFHERLLESCIIGITQRKWEKLRNICCNRLFWPRPPCTCPVWINCDKHYRLMSEQIPTGYPTPGPTFQAK
jgi:hypothetical protein